MSNTGEFRRRRDRLEEAPCAKNAQGLFLPGACIFVGNLSTKVSLEQLAEDLEALFSRFGRCYAKIKQGKKKDLPGAFVQFEHVKDANNALACEERLVLHDRPLRIERAKGKRTAVFGLRSGAPITQSDVHLALGGRGPLENHYIEPHFNHVHGWTSICKVTFVYVDDCRDAIKFFSRDDIYWMKMVDMEGSPSPNGQRYSHRRPLPQSTPPHARHGNGNRQGRWFGSRPQRAGYPPTFNRGGYRSFPRNHPQNSRQETRNSPNGAYQSPQFFNGMSYAAENCPPYYPPHLHAAQASAAPSLPLSHPPPHLPPPNNENGYGYQSHYSMQNGYPEYTGPHMPHHPPAYAPAPPHQYPSTTGPYMANPPVYSPITPPYYGENCHPDQGYFGPQPSMNNYAGGYCGQPGPVYYGDACAQRPMYHTPPWQAHHATPPPSPPNGNDSTNGHAAVHTENRAPSQSPQKPKVEEKSEEEVDIFNLPEPDKPPRLIRVYQSDSETESKTGKGKGKCKAKETHEVQPSKATTSGTTDSKSEPQNDETKEVTSTDDKAKETPNGDSSKPVATSNTGSMSGQNTDATMEVKSTEDNAKDSQDGESAKSTPSSSTCSESVPKADVGIEADKVKPDEEKGNETQKPEVSPKRPCLTYPKRSERNLPKLSLKTSIKKSPTSSPDNSPVSSPERSRSPRDSCSRSPKLPTIIEEDETNGDKAESETTTLESSSGSEVDFEPSTTVLKEEETVSINPTKEAKSPRSTSPTDDCPETRGRSATRRPLPAEYQPKTGTIESYVRWTAAQFVADNKWASALSEEKIREVIQELENERRSMFEMFEGKTVESGSSNRSASPSVGRSSSSNSI